MTIKDGKRLEQYLDWLHARYRQQGTALVAKVPNPVRILSAGNPRQRNGPVKAHLLPPVWVDYTGVVMGGIAVAIEAKCTTDKGPSFSLSKLAKHQHKTLSEMHAMGGIAAVYIRHLRQRHDQYSSAALGADYLVPIAFIDALAKRSFRWAEVEHFKVPAGKAWLDALTDKGWDMPLKAPPGKTWLDALANKGWDMPLAWSYYAENGWAE